MARPYVFEGVADGPGSDAVVYDFGKLAWRAVFVGGGLGLFLGGSAIAYIVDPAAVAYGGHASTTERVIAAFFAGVFLLVALIMLVMALPMTRKYYGIAVDRRGIWWRDRSLKLMYRIPWGDILAVGGSAARARSPQPGGNTSVANYVSIYFADPQIVRRHPELERAGGAVTLLTEHGSEPGAFSVRLRIQLMPFTRLPSKLESAVRRFAPQLWQG